MRSFGDLTPDEQSLFRIHRRRVENDLCTPQEKKESQAFMDGMLHKGPTGPVMAKLAEFEKRLGAVETTKGNRKFLVTAKDIRALRDELDELKATVGQLQNAGEDVKAYLLDECRTAIMAEADAAAKIAVDNYMKGTEF